MSAGHEVGEEVRKAVAAGRRVQETVRNATLKALTQRELDHAALRKVTHETLNAVREAAEAQGANARQAAKEAVDGVAHALAHAAQALSLSVEEAAGRAQQFSREDLARARDDIAELEKMFVDTLQETSRNARGTASAVFKELAEHARASGTAIGRQMEETGTLTSQLAEAGRAQFSAGAAAAAASGAMLARIASGVLAGMADALAGERKPPAR
jgi:hypothetical protein